MKRVKAWAVVDANGELKTMNDDYEISTRTDDFCPLREGERVVPVVIEIQEEK